MADPLEFLDHQAMSEQERDALALTTGGTSPTTEVQPEPVQTPSIPAQAATPPAGTTEADFQDDGTGHRVPLTALLAERERRQGAERERDELRARHTTQEGGLPEIVIPDPAVDLPGYIRVQQGINNMQLLNERMNVSERFARKEHGNEMVDKAMEWALGQFEANPAYEEQIMGQPDPYDVVIKDFQGRQRVAETEGDEYKQFLEWKKAQAGGDQGGATGGEVTQTPSQPAVAQAAAQPAASTPPRSIAGMASGGGKPHEVPAGPGQAFDNVFK